MPRPPYPRNVADFNRMFPDEEACVAYLAAMPLARWLPLPAVRDRTAFDLPRRRLWQCKACGHQTSVTAGTVMHRTRTPLLTWFWAAFWMTAHKPGLSALQLQHMLGLTRYETAWLILHKLRRAMVNANREPLKGTVEIDETFIGGEQLGLRGGRQLAGRKALARRGRRRGPRQGVGARAGRGYPGRDGTDPLAVHRPQHRAGLDRCSRTVTAATRARRAWQPRATPTCRAPRRVFGAGTEDVVPHAHRAISQLKAWLLGTHRGVGADHLPIYLDEFVFRWNRRHAPMAGFQTLLGLGTHREPTTYRRSSGSPEAGEPRSRGRKTGLTLTA